MTDNERRIYLLRIRGLEEDIDSCIDIDKNNLLEIERLRKLVPDQEMNDLIKETLYDAMRYEPTIAIRAAIKAAIDKLGGYEDDK